MDTMIDYINQNATFFAVACAAAIGLIYLLFDLAAFRSTLGDLRDAKARIATWEKRHKASERIAASIQQKLDKKGVEHTAIRVERDGLRRELRERLENADRIIDECRTTIEDEREMRESMRAHLIDLIERLDGEVPSPFSVGSATAALYAITTRLKQNGEAFTALIRERDLCMTKLAGHERFLMDLSVATAQITKNPIQTLNFGEILDRMDNQEKEGDSGEVTPPLVFRNEQPDHDEEQGVGDQSLIESHIRRVRERGRGPFNRAPRHDEVD